MELSKEQQEVYDLLTNEGQTIFLIIGKLEGASEHDTVNTLHELNQMGLAIKRGIYWSKQTVEKKDPNPVNDDTVTTNYNLDAQFAFYLKKVNLDPKAISQTQLVETKRAFFGACGQMLLLMGNLGTMSENDAYDTTQDLLEQVGKFWERQ